MNNVSQRYGEPAKMNHFEGDSLKTNRGHGKLLESHNLLMGYVLWLFGFLGAHRFYFGRPISGVLWLFTFGLFGIGWLIDICLIPDMKRTAEIRFQSGSLDYSLGWFLFIFLGVFGVHRFYLSKGITGLVFFFTAGLFGFGLIYDLLTLNDQISDINHRRLQTY